MMGTNYYATEPACESACEHCTRGEAWHVCKSLVTIQAHEETPWGRIWSWQDWKRAILANRLRIRDEYGGEHDPAEFIASVESTGIENRRGQYRWMVDHGMAHPGEENPTDWLDDDGFSVTRSEFT